MHLEILNDKQKKILPWLKEFSSSFGLVGGTALALQIGHRQSIDFDLFSNKPFNNLNLLGKILKHKKITKTLIDHDGELTVVIEGVKITFLYYPFPILFDFVLLQNVKALGVKELAATKAYTVGRRGTYKDYADLYFIISEKHSTLDEIMEMAEKKYAEFNSRLFLEQLIYLDDIYDTNIIFLKNTLTKEQIKAFFIDEIGKIKL